MRKSKLWRKCLLSILGYSILLIIFIYAAAIIILFYIGPLETRLVKKNLTKTPARIVISLSVTANNMQNIQTTLNAIIRQSIKPDRIYLNITRKNTIPYWLIKLANNNPNIIINVTNNNYGTANKILGILNQETDPNTIIVTLENGLFYPKHTIRDLIKQYLSGTYKINYKLNSVVTGTGLNILFGRHFALNYYLIVMPDRPSLNIVGVDGVAYKRGFFSKDLIDFMHNIPINCQQSDDLMLSVYLVTRSISIVKIAGISFNEVMKNLLTTRLNLADYYKDYGTCLSAFPEYNKQQEQEKFLYRTKVLYSLFYWDISRNYCYQQFYIYLEKFIKNMPFLVDLIVWVMK